MRKIIILFIFTLFAGTISVNDAIAQRATSSDDFEAKASAKALKTPRKPRTATVPKALNNASTPTVTNLPSSAPAAIYARLVQRQNAIHTSLEAITASAATLKGAKAKKALKQIDALQAENRSITTQIDLLPRAAKDPQYALEIEHQEKEQFKQQLRQESDKAISQINPYAGELSSDPELQRAYRDYIARNITNDDSSIDGVTFRIMFAISKKPLAKSSIKLSPVLSQKLSNGSTAYYYGDFRSKEDAQSACNKILATGRYRDAFVVAMDGDKRIAMPR